MPSSADVAVNYRSGDFVAACKDATGGAGGAGSDGASGGQGGDVSLVDEVSGSTDGNVTLTSFNIADPLPEAKYDLL